MTDNDIDYDELVERFVDEETNALLLVGSRARGDHGPMSDVDLARHVTAPTEHGRVVSTIDSVGRLVTIKTLAQAREEEALRRPGAAVWQVPTLRDAVLLFDRDDGAARLIRQARDFTWENLGNAPDRHVASEVVGAAEEALKIAGGLQAANTAQVLYGTMGMVLGLAEAMAVHRRVFITSENRLFEIALDAMADQPAWTTSFRVASGFGADDAMARGWAALTLYGETLSFIGPLLDDGQRAVADVAVASSRRVR